METSPIPDLIRMNKKNEGFWSFENQSQSSVAIHQMTQCYTEGHDKIFDYFGRDLDASCKWFVGYTAVLLNPKTGEIFMQDHGRFTFFQKYIPMDYGRQVTFLSADGYIDLTAMGPLWGRAIDQEDPDEDAALVKNILDALVE